MGRGGALVLTVLAAAGCPGNKEPKSTGAAVASYQSARVAPAPPIDEDGSWTMPAKDYAARRFSNLAEITRDNVGGLELAWSMKTGLERGHEAAPLVVGDTMYVITPYPNWLYAIDLTRPPAVKWKYEPGVISAAQGVACCDVVNRGGTFASGRIHYATLDGQIVSVDATTGAEVWKTRIADINKGETITMAPLVVKDTVLVGNSGGEMGVRGWLKGVDLTTGQVKWTAYSTGPDREVLIGASYRPFYEQERGEDLGVKTWPPGRWETGGGTVWGWISYDPALDLIYYGTANPGPWNPAQRSGDNKFTAGVFARRPDTGEAVWFYQWSPHDHYDHDGVNENVLVDMEIDGKLRHVLIHPERNGYIYVMDRATGEVLSADPFVHITTSRGVDLETGRLLSIEAKHPRQGHVVREICPAAPGAKDWQPSAFSPRTGLLYIPHQNLCQDEEAVEVSYIAGTPFVGANVRMYAGPGGHMGEFTAWDPAQRKAVFKLKEEFPVWSGALVTAGDVVFYGTMDGWFKAIDAKTGDLLWKHKAGSGFIGQPITYRGPDGRQYVAILSGVGGWSGAVVAQEIDWRDDSAALGFAHAMKDLPRATKKGGEVLVFALPAGGAR